jgi:hypothetical protein
LEYRIALSLSLYRVIQEEGSTFLGGDSIDDGEKKVHMNMYLLLNYYINTIV